VIFIFLKATRRRVDDE
jgi:hypothetical protein